MTRVSKEGQVLKDLGDGLALRRGRSKDAEALAEFNGRIHLDGGSPDEWVMNWTRDLASGRRPGFAAEDFTIVEDTRTGTIISSMCLIPQAWSYGGIQFPIGRPELVGTLPEYRKRGLVRAQFDVIHQWGAERGELVQAITGIPWFYRQFGYEMALELDHWRGLPTKAVPKLGKGEKEPYRVRQAKEVDVSFIAQVYHEGMARSLVSSVQSPTAWRYQLSGRTMSDSYRIIESADGRRTGFLAHYRKVRGGWFGVTVCELRRGANWLAATPAILRYLQKTGTGIAGKQKQQLEGLSFHLSAEHPMCQMMADYPVRAGRPYAYYVRVPDLPAFMKRIAPVLEERVASSPICGYTGELKLGFYTSGLLLAFRNGRLRKAAAWTPEGGSSASFPNLTFLQLLFCYRSLDELAHAHADFGVRGNEARVALNVLFPKMASYVWAIE